MVLEFKKPIQPLQAMPQAKSRQLNFSSLVVRFDLIGPPESAYDHSGQGSLFFLKASLTQWPYLFLFLTQVTFDFQR